jgi:hypothetical protein
MYIEWFLNLYKVNRDNERYKGMKHNLESVAKYISEQQEQK